MCGLLGSGTGIHPGKFSRDAWTGPCLTPLQVPALTTHAMPSCSRSTLPSPLSPLPALLLSKPVSVKDMQNRWTNTKKHRCTAPRLPQHSFSSALPHMTLCRRPRRRVPHGPHEASQVLAASTDPRTAPESSAHGGLSACAYSLLKHSRTSHSPSPSCRQASLGPQTQWGALCFCHPIPSFQFFFPYPIPTE